MGFADEGEQMRLVSSRTLLTAVAGLIAVPGAAIAAAGPDTALLQVGSSNEEIDCEEYGDDLDDLEDVDAEILEACSLLDDHEGEDEDEEREGGEDGEDGEEREDGDEGEDLEEGEERDAGDDGVEGDLIEDGDEAPGVEDIDDTETSQAHGRIVSTVAHCAPRGQERLEGFDLPNLGAYVSTAARGEVLSVAGREFDLSTLEGAEELCSAIEQARAGDAADASPAPPVEDGAEADVAGSTHAESRPSSQRGGPPEGKGDGRGAARQEGGPGNSGNAPGRNR
jgi:hypothetical protein